MFCVHVQFRWNRFAGWHTRCFDNQPCVVPQNDITTRLFYFTDRIKHYTQPRCCDPAWGILNVLSLLDRNHPWISSASRGLRRWLSAWSSPHSAAGQPAYSVPFTTTSLSPQWAETISHQLALAIQCSICIRNVQVQIHPLSWIIEFWHFWHSTVNENGSCVTVQNFAQSVREKTFCIHGIHLLPYGILQFRVLVIRFVTSKSDYISLKYGDMTIFKMAGLVHQFEFSKFEICGI